MVIEFNLKMIKKGDKEYSPAKLTIDEEKLTAEFYILKKGLFFRQVKQLPIANISFGVGTKIQGKDKLTIEVEDITVVAENELDAEKIMALLLKPAIEFKEKIKEIKEMVSKILLTRAKVFEDILMLQSSPRKMLLSEKIEEIENPVKYYIQKKENEIAIELEEFKEKIKKESVDETIIENVCAFIVGVTAIQNAMFSKDKKMLDEALNFISELKVKASLLEDITTTTNNLIEGWKIYRIDI